MFNYFTNDLPGMPAFSSVAQITHVLKAALETGVGLSVVNQIVISNGLAVIHVQGTPVALQQGLVELAGITGAAASLNGKHRVVSVDAGTISVEVTAEDAILASAGMTVRVPPLGWDVEFNPLDDRQATIKSRSPLFKGGEIFISDTGHTHTGGSVSGRSSFRIFAFDKVTGVVDGVPSGEEEWGTFLSVRKRASGNQAYAVWGDDRFVAIAINRAAATFATSPSYIVHSGWGDIDDNQDGWGSCVFSNYAFGYGPASINDSVMRFRRNHAGNAGSIDYAASVVSPLPIKINSFVSGGISLGNGFPGTADDTITGKAWLMRSAVGASSIYRGCFPGVMLSTAVNLASHVGILDIANLRGEDERVRPLLTLGDTYVESSGSPQNSNGRFFIDIERFRRAP